MPPTVAVHGLRELSAAFAKAAKDTRTEFRGELRDVAEPVRRDAEALARSEIPTVGDAWAQMRTAVTRRLVYVAPRQRGVKGRAGSNRRARPKFGTLLMDRAMQPALERNAAGIERRFEDALDRLAERWEHD